MNWSFLLYSFCVFPKFLKKYLLRFAKTVLNLLYSRFAYHQEIAYL